ncbi:skin secretory protein xP2-like isoform X1 [Cervus elaphus]|uniref:skin secretory protein xP2-like isoform X1 n=1 Tax=Cervus elaphus TaxID=9860 RepID=UPI001CC2F05A|nr:skin secretory protein xP2-like isoform X1 [Cervus elaphus]
MRSRCAARACRGARGARRGGRAAPGGEGAAAGGKSRAADRVGAARRPGLQPVSRSPGQGWGAPLPGPGGAMLRAHRDRAAPTPAAAPASRRSCPGRVGGSRLGPGSAPAGTPAPRALGGPGASRAGEEDDQPPPPPRGPAREPLPTPHLPLLGSAVGVVPPSAAEGGAPELRKAVGEESAETEERQMTEQREGWPSQSPSRCSTGSPHIAVQGQRGGGGRPRASPAQGPPRAPRGEGQLDRGCRGQGAAAPPCCPAWEEERGASWKGGGWPGEAGADDPE